jgi:hypothetical protein
MKNVTDLLLQRTSLEGLTYIAERRRGKWPSAPKLDHIACFSPGVAVWNSLLRMSAASVGLAALCGGAS